MPRNDSLPPERTGGPVKCPVLTSQLCSANATAPLDHPHGCKDVASMFLGCSLLVSSFLAPLFLPSWPWSQSSRNPTTRALHPYLRHPGRTPGQNDRTFYIDDEDGVKVTGIAAASATVRICDLSERGHSCPPDVNTLAQADKNVRAPRVAESSCAQIPLPISHSRLYPELCVLP